MLQQHFQFLPAVLPVQTGTLVEFPNLDDSYHNVFSYSKAKRFDLGRYRKDEKPPAIVFDKPGAVKLYCEIHEHMRAIPDRLAGGLELDRAAAELALGDFDPEAVVEVVNAEMLRALRLVSIERGHDPRDFVLVAFGGAGPLHAAALAPAVGSTIQLKPRSATKRSVAAAMSSIPMRALMPWNTSAAPRRSRRSTSSRSQPIWRAASAG